MDIRARKRIIIIGIVSILVIAVIYVVYLVNTSQENKTVTIDQSKENIYIDPYSGEEVIDPPNKTPETYGTNNTTITYLGFSKLLNYGMTQNQLTTLKGYIQQFSIQREASDASTIKEVTINFDTYRQSINSKGVSVTNFDIIINRDEELTFSMNIISESINSISIKIYMKNDNTKPIYEASPASSYD